MKNAFSGIVLLLGTGGLLSEAHAGGIDLALSDETANVAVLLNPGEFYRVDGSELAIGGFISEEDDRLAHVSLMARGYRQSATSQYSLAAGIKAVVGEVAIDEERVAQKGGDDAEKVGAVGLGLQAGFLVAASRYNPMELTFGAFYAPSITSFSDAEQFTELTARLEIEVIPQASAYVGYRRMGFDTNDYDDVRLDRAVHIGLKIVY